MQLRKVQLQPFLIVVGPELTEIEEKYLCMGGIFYKLNSTIEAIDILFQLFHSLDINFPAESTFIWQILEEGIYGIKSQNIETNAAGILLSLQNWRNSQPVIRENNRELLALTDNVNETYTDEESFLRSQSSEITHSLSEST